MTFIVSGSDGLTFPNSTTQASAGIVLQVVSAVTSTQGTSSTSTYADSSLTANITPKFSTSKILVIVDQTGLAKSTNDVRVKLKLLRNSTDLIEFEFNAGFTNSSATNRVGGASVNYLDSPATTSAVTYKTQFASLTNAGFVYVQVDNCYSSITLMEIAG
jgi:hypothetical protein